MPFVIMVGLPGTTLPNFAVIRTNPVGFPQPLRQTHHAFPLPVEGLPSEDERQGKTGKDRFRGN